MTPQTDSRKTIELVMPVEETHYPRDTFRERRAVSLTLCAQDLDHMQKLIDRSQEVDADLVVKLRYHNETPTLRIKGDALWVEDYDTVAMTLDGTRTAQVAIQLASPNPIPFQALVGAFNDAANEGDLVVAPHTRPHHADDHATWINVERGPGDATLVVLDPQVTEHISKDDLPECIGQALDDDLTPAQALQQHSRAAYHIGRPCCVNRPGHTEAQRTTLVLALEPLGEPALDGLIDPEALQIPLYEKRFDELLDLGVDRHKGAFQIEKRMSGLTVRGGNEAVLCVKNNGEISARASVDLGMTTDSGVRVQALFECPAVDVSALCWMHANCRNGSIIIPLDDNTERLIAVDENDIGQHDPVSLALGLRDRIAQGDDLSAALTTLGLEDLAPWVMHSLDE